MNTTNYLKALIVKADTLRHDILEYNDNLERLIHEHHAAQPFDDIDRLYLEAETIGA